MEISALFQGPIDLHIPANRNVLIQFIEDSPLVDPDLRLNAREILDCFLACLSDKVSVQSILGLDGGYISVSIDNCRDSLGLPLQDFLRTGFLLMQLSNCRGFQKLISGFHNSTRQFASTRFEVESAFYCYTRPTFQYLEFSPTYLVKGKQKRPDFEVRTTHGTLVCECKTIDTIELKCRLAHSKLHTALDAALQQLEVRVPDDVRIDIVITAAPKGDRTRFAVMVAKEIDTMLQSPIPVQQQYDSMTVHIGPRNLPPTQTERCIAEMSCVVGQVPTQVGYQGAYLRTSTSRFIPRITKAIGCAINDALTQLPLEHNNIIFLEVPSYEYSKAAIDSRFSLPTYQHIMAYGVYGRRKGDLWFSGKNDSLDRLRSFFGDVTI